MLKLPQIFSSRITVPYLFPGHDNW